MAKCMSYQEGKIDSPFSLRCEIQILMQYRSCADPETFENVFLEGREDPH